MACLISPPSGNVKGVVTFTTQERDRLIFRFSDIRELLVQLKERYVVGLHHNWHDHNLEYNKLFDFHLAGEEDLRTNTGLKVPLVPMDACNFTPEYFRQTNIEKFWDILFVARAVEFKGIPEFLKAIRHLYDRGEMLRVLFICPLPPDNGPGSFRNVRTLYEAMFNSHEQDYFTLLTTEFRYPFPFDLPTLATFYKASRVFVHSAPDERRCRVAAYAWACGMPVVGMAPVGSILSLDDRTSPYFYEIGSYEEFPDQILLALQASREQLDFGIVVEQVSASKTVPVFTNHLVSLFRTLGLETPLCRGWFEDLDIRLGRHHGLPAGTNQIIHDIHGFMSCLLTADDVIITELLNFKDPELRIAERFPLKPREHVPERGTKTVFGRLTKYAIEKKRQILGGSK